MRERQEIRFTSRLSRLQTVLVLLWLPVHVYGLPWLLYSVVGVKDSVELNFLTYLIGAVFLLLVCARFLRRDFDMLCEQPFRIFLQVLGCYAAMLLMNMAVSGLVSVFVDALENPNNETVMDMVGEQYGKMSAVAIFLAPFVEELIFRAGIFGTLRRRSRWAAYAVSMLLFSIYHVWGYALTDPALWIYLLQYLPAAYLLCRCYEYCDSIWGSYFLHMLINFISIKALMLLEELL